MSVEIRCENITKGFTTRHHTSTVLDNVNLAVQPGEFVALLGPSGCGKSTLLMMLAGLEESTRGSVYVDNSLVVGPRAQTAIMFQDPTLLPWRSALDNILFPIQMQRKLTQQDIDHAHELLEQVGLQHASSLKPRQLSGGMRQRVSLCRALISKPDVLLMDEPFSALDAIVREEMNELVLRLCQHYRTTIVLVTHSIPEALLLADRVLTLGGTPSHITSEKTVPFPRPRDFGLVDSTEFGDLSRQVRELIRGTRTRNEIVRMLT